MFALLLLATAATVEPASERWTVPAALVASLREVGRRPLAERMEIASRPFVGLPYVAGAAGELDAIDPGPPSRYDAFDCLTFVEEVLALSLAADPLYAPAIRDALRYEGPPSYASRRHSMELEWIPGVLRTGLATDITARLGPSRTLTHTTTREAWGSWYGRTLLHLPDDRLPVGTWSLDYLDLDAAAQADIPPGAVILVLRPPHARNPVSVTHVGIVVETHSLRVRHASRNGRGRVRDDALSDFIRRQRAYENRPVMGVTVLLPREEGPRISAMVASAFDAQYPPAHVRSLEGNASPP